LHAIFDKYLGLIPAGAFLELVFAISKYLSLNTKKQGKMHFGDRFGRRWDEVGGDREHINVNRSESAI
jgi:hypothetical protein